MAAKPSNIKNAPVIPAYVPTLLAALIGIVAGVAMSRAGYPRLAPLVGWDLAVAVFGGWVIVRVFPMSIADTEKHASREDPGRVVSDTLFLFASVVSLVAVGYLLAQAGNMHGRTKLIDVGLGVASVILSWAVVHVVFTLRYARLYYNDEKDGIDFHQDDKPNYLDFAYMAFTVGMTFQVSDTDIKSKKIRATILHQALLSYLFGTVIVATAINLVAGLGK